TSDLYTLSLHDALPIYMGKTPGDGRTTPPAVAELRLRTRLWRDRAGPALVQGGYATSGCPHDGARPSAASSRSRTMAAARSCAAGSGPTWMRPPAIMS